MLSCQLTGFACQVSYEIAAMKVNLHPYHACVGGRGKTFDSMHSFDI
jgi:hypothetical protein